MPSFSPLEDEKVYQIVAPTYLIEGGDGYDMIKPNLVSRHINGKKSLNNLSVWRVYVDKK
jgi:5'-nucleotidase